MLIVENLSKTYGNRTILSDISLQCKPGEIHGIVGSNGAGKTTLFKCITGLERFQGKIYSTTKNKSYNIGFLETNPPFLSKITGKEYLQLVCNARNIQPPDFKSANLFDLPLQQYAETYSTGMKKKLAFTGILLQQNDIFILDEPFNGVDIQSNITLQTIIKKLKESGKIILLSSHIFNVLRESCDYLHYLHNGKMQKSVTEKSFSEIENLMKDAAFEHKLDIFNIK